MLSAIEIVEGSIYNDVDKRYSLEELSKLKITGVLICVRQQLHVHNGEQRSVSCEECS
jgi:hypothetical protein